MMNESSSVLDDPLSMQRHQDRVSRDAARRRLEESAYSQLRHIHCHVRYGVLRLLGTVTSYHLRQVAQATVRGMAGIESIDNQLEVVADRFNRLDTHPKPPVTSDECYS